MHIALKKLLSHGIFRVALWYLLRDTSALRHISWKPLFYIELSVCLSVLYFDAMTYMMGLFQLKLIHSKLP